MQGDHPKRRISSVEGLSMAEQQLMERIMVGLVWYLHSPKAWKMVTLANRYLHNDIAKCTHALLHLAK